MMGGPPTNETVHTVPIQARSPDAGILSACRAKNYQTIANVLIVHPPHSPAVDVYDQGRLIAGYRYASIPDCRKEIGIILG